MNWTVTTSTERNNVGIFPGLAYSHTCGVSRDGSMFMIHSGQGSQQFSIQIPTQENYSIDYVLDTYSNSTKNSPTRQLHAWAEEPSLLMPTTDFSLPQNTSTTDTMHAPRQDWMHLHGLFGNDLAISRSNDSFPILPQKSIPGLVCVQQENLTKKNLPPLKETNFEHKTQLDLTPCPTFSFLFDPHTVRSIIRFLYLGVFAWNRL